MSRLRTIKTALRAVVSRLVTYRQGTKPNLAVFGIGRGGSTLMVDMLSVEPGMWAVGEPFPPMESRPDFKVLGKWLTPARHDQYFNLNDEVRDQIGRFITALLKGEIPIGFCRRPRFPLRADRMLLKILHSPALIDWLADSFGFQVVFLTRHPAPVALSVFRHGWGCPAEALSERLDSLRQLLSDPQIEFGRRIVAAGSPWQQEILAWVTENYIPVYHSKRVSLLITHEELTLGMPAMVRLLCQRFELQSADSILSNGRRPSGSSQLSSQEHRHLIKRGATRSLIESWRDKVDAAQASQAQEILDRFEMPIYNMNDCLPDPRFRVLPAENSTPMVELGVGKP
jgi:hypothetical protein